MTQLRRCSGCQEEYPATAEFFHRNGIYFSKCKSCERERRKKKRADIKENPKKLAIHRKYQASKKENTENKTPPMRRDSGIIFVRDTIPRRRLTQNGTVRR